MGHTHGQIAFNQLAHIVVGGEGRRDQDGLLNLVRVPVDMRAVIGQDLDFMPEGLRRAEAVPHVRVARHNAQGHLLPAGPNQNRRVGLLNRFGLKGRVVQMVMPARKFCPLPGPELFNQGDGLVQADQPLPGGGKGNVICLVLQRKPAAANPENQPSVADDIHRGRHFGQDRRVAIGIARHHDTQAHPLGCHSQRR